MSSNQSKSPKDPQYAAKLALIYPPAGYWYAGKKITAVFLFFAEDLMYLLIPFAGFGLVCLLLFRLFCRWEVRKVVEKYNRKLAAAAPVLNPSLSQQ